MKDQLLLRKLKPTDCQSISDAFAAQGWDKPVAQYERYWAYQESGERDIIVAEWEGHFAGYLTIQWTSNYTPFREKNIPEVVDFNALKKYQRLGIGTRLMDEAEARIARVSPVAGIGVGVLADYGAAQILYIKRGYVPDGRGLQKDATSLAYGEQVTVDDGLVLCLTKQLLA